MFLNLIAPINQLGYGVVGFNILKALVERGHTMSYFPIGDARWDSDLSFVKKCIENSKMFDKDAPSIRIWHQHDLAMFPGGGPRIGWPIFELNKFTDVERNHLESVDRLFVCSDWARSVLIENEIQVPIDVVPLGVDPKVFYVDETARANRAYWTREKTVFINVGKWEIRKGHDTLLDAFNKAFTPGDNVELWMMNHNPFIGIENENWKTRYVGSPMGRNIKLLPRVNSQAELRMIYNTVDFGVFPARAEGWNLEVLELMACGVPSVVTNYSGHTQFCSEQNSLLVDTNGMAPAQDGKWFHGQGEWCTYDIDELVEKMRQAHELKQSNSHNELIYHALETAKDFSWNNSAMAIESHL